VGRRPLELAAIPFVPGASVRFSPAGPGLARRKESGPQPGDTEEQGGGYDVPQAFFWN